jgi:hypothetical protein
MVDVELWCNYEKEKTERKIDNTAYRKGLPLEP